MARRARTRPPAPMARHPPLTTARSSFPAMELHRVYGTLDPQQASISFAIPITSENGNILVMLRPIAGKFGNEYPVLEAVGLADGQGRPISSTGLPWMTQSNNHLEGALISVQQVPAGSEIVIQVDSAGMVAATTSATGTTNVTASAGTTSSGTAWSVPFIMDVMRQNQPIASAIAAMVASGNWSISDLGATGSSPSALGSATTRGRVFRHADLARKYQCHGRRFLDPNRRERGRRRKQQ